MKKLFALFCLTSFAASAFALELSPGERVEINGVQVSCGQSSGAALPCKIIPYYSGCPTTYNVGLLMGEGSNSSRDCYANLTDAGEAYSNLRKLGVCR